MKTKPRIRKCSLCHTYTMALEHHNTQTSIAHPPIFKPNDRLSEYRVIVLHGNDNKEKERD
ncbi:MAG: ribosome biogenesis protein [Methanobacteriota archaeon]|nr:MAG: ribosome biogenesis protein [Euryarchaeota archaeon]